MLEELTKNVWIAAGSCVNFHGFAYPTRSVVVRLASGDIWVWSPISFDAELAAQIRTLGPVAHLVSPNKIHHLFLADWAAHFPDAKLWGPRTTIAKRRDLTFEPPLDEEPPAPWADDFAHFHVKGSLVMDEILFLHRASGTLIMADFSEHFSNRFLQRNWRPWQRVIGRLWGITEGRGQAPLDWRLSFLNRRHLRVMKRDLLSRDVRRVVMAHGEIVRADAPGFLERSLGWI